MKQEHLDHLHSNVPPSYYHEGVKKNLAQKYWHWRRRNIIKRMVKDTGGSFLDFGCHGGYLTEYMAHVARATHVTAIDISPEAIEFVKQRHPDWTALCANVEEPITQISNDSVRFIACIDVLEHLLHPEKVIEEAARIAEKNALFVIAIPKETILWKSIWYLWTKLGPGKVWDDVHVQDFSVDGLDTIFKHYGFHKEDDALIHVGIYRIVKYRYVR